MMPTHVTFQATVLVFVISLLSAPQSATAAFQAVTSREAEELVRYHNKVRDEVGVGPVEWSPALARFAQEWADEVARTGRIGHRPGEGEFAQRYGENIAWGSGGGFDVLTGARSWYEEKKSYTPGTPIPRDFRDFKAGHYTQMVWEDTTEIGAGKAVIQAGDRKGSLLVVCNYNPRGNMIGEEPFIAGGDTRGGDAQGGGETASAKLGSTSLRVLEPVDVEGPFPELVREVEVGDVVQLQIAHPVRPPFPSEASVKVSNLALTALFVTSNKGQVAVTGPKQGVIGGGYFSAFVRASNSGEAKAVVTATYPDGTKKVVPFVFKVNDRGGGKDRR